MSITLYLSVILSVNSTRFLAIHKKRINEIIINFMNCLNCNDGQYDFKNLRNCVILIKAYESSPSLNTEYLYTCDYKNFNFISFTPFSFRKINEKDACCKD